MDDVHRSPKGESLLPPGPSLSSGHRVAGVVCATAAALLCLGPATAQAEKGRVGVVVNLSVNMEKGESTALATTLGDALRGALEIDVVAGNEVERRMPANGVPQECIAEAACVADMAERLDATQLLFLVVVRVGARVQIDTTWVDVASGRKAARDAILIEDSGSSVNEIFSDAAVKLLPDEPRKVSTVPPGDNNSGSVRPPNDNGPGDPRVVTPTGDNGESPTSRPVSRPSGSAIDSSPEPQGRRMTPAAWITTGAAGAMLVGGSLLALSAQSQHNKLEDSGCRDDMSCSDEDVSALRNRALGADILFAAALATGAVAAVLYWRSGGSTRVGVNPSANGASVWLGGEF